MILKYTVQERSNFDLFKFVLMFTFELKKLSSLEPHMIDSAMIVCDYL